MRRLLVLLFFAGCEGVVDVRGSVPVDGTVVLSVAITESSFCEESSGRELSAESVRTTTDDWRLRLRFRGT